MRLVAFVAVLLAGCSLAAARPPDPCSLTSTVTDAKLTLSIPDSRTPGTIKPSNPQGSTVNQDGFLLKVSADGSTLLYGTYLGGRGTDVANACRWIHKAKRS